MNKKILIVLSTNEYVRNYIESGAFFDLEKDFNCFYLVSNKVDLNLLKKNNINFTIYIDDPDQSLMSYNFFITLMFRYRKKSSSFKFRINRLFFIRGNTDIEKFQTIIHDIIKFNFKSLKILIFRFYKIVLSSNIPFFFYKELFYIKHKLNNKLVENVFIYNPSLILFPSSAYDPIGIDIALISKKNHQIKSFFLIDNWDNLSSKSILYDKPTYLGVWSKQSLKHAIEIQNFNKNAIFILGTPRFNHYFHDRNINLISHFNFKYILFVGTAVEFDEAGILISLDKLMEKHNNIFQSIKILYRPHPWRQGKDSILDMNLKHVIIDPQLMESYSKSDVSSSVQPDLKYYSSLIKNCEFVIGGLTSMLIEALIFKKTYFALAYDDKKNLTSQHNMFKHYVHFKGIENISAIHLFENLENLEVEFLDFYNTYLLRVIDNVDDEREYFLYQHEKLNYSNLLNNAVKEILL